VKLFDEEEFESENSDELRRLMALEFVQCLINFIRASALQNDIVHSLIYHLIEHYGFSGYGFNQIISKRKFGR
jgi:hypothetical protein